MSRLPKRRSYARGSEKGLDEDVDDKEMFGLVASRQYARGTVLDRISRRRWWLRRCGARGIDPYPLTPGKITVAAALLIKGMYRSGPLYLVAMKHSHISHGFEWPPLLAQELRDARRAVTRGLGPNRQSV